MTSADLLDKETPPAAEERPRRSLAELWTEKCEAIVAAPFWAMLGLVVIAPLFLGGVPDWAWTMIASLQAVTAIAWAVIILVRHEPIRVPMADLAPAGVFFAITISWAVAQTMPGLFPDRHHPIGSEARNAGLPVVSRISIDPEATWSGIARLLSYAGVFIVIAAYCRSSRRAHQVFYVLGVAGTVYAAYGLIVFLSGIKITAPWAPKQYYLESLTSTFVNRNTYATYAGLGLLCVIGLLLHELTEKRRGVGKREAFRDLIERLTQRGWVLALGIVLITTALLLTKSRGGLGASIVGIAALVLTGWMGGAIKRGTFLVVVAASLIVGAGFLALSGEGVATRLQSINVEGEDVATEVLSERSLVYQLTIQAIMDNPLLGTGLGTFAEVFQLYRDESISAFYEDAHNTYLENALELGIPAALSLGLSVAYIFFVCVRGVGRRRRDQLYPTIGVAATALVAVHALVDFSLEMPGVTWTYMAIMGAALAQSRSSRSGI